jgi:hypothetical protein
MPGTRLHRNPHLLRSALLCLLLLPSPATARLCDPGDYFLDRPILQDKMVAMLENDCVHYTGVLHLSARTLDRLTMPRLLHADGILIDAESRAFIELNLPALTSLGSLKVVNARALESVKMPQLRSLGTLSISKAPRLVGITLPSLQVRVCRGHGRWGGAAGKGVVVGGGGGVERSRYTRTSSVVRVRRHVHLLVVRAGR